MYKKYIKRLLDIILSLIFIVILFPVMILMCIITKIEFKGKIIYKQINAFIWRHKGSK